MRHMSDFKTFQGKMDMENIKTEEVNKEAENTFSSSGLSSTSGVDATKEVVDPKTFKMPKAAEDTLDSYIAKLEDYHSKIGDERNDVIAQKAKVLQAVLEADMLHTK